jgi:hypothetical protein
MWLISLMNENNWIKIPGPSTLLCISGEYVCCASARCQCFFGHARDAARPWCADLSSRPDLSPLLSRLLIRPLELVRGNGFSLVHLNSAHLLPLCVAITRVNINFLWRATNSQTSASCSSSSTLLVLQVSAQHRPKLEKRDLCVLLLCLWVLLKCCLERWAAATDEVFYFFLP